MAEPAQNPQPHTIETEPASITANGSTQQQQQNGDNTHTSTQPAMPAASTDVEMTDSAPAAQTPTQPPTTAPTPTLTAATTAAPVQQHTTASSRNSPHPSFPMSAPTHPNPHGSPTRLYLNQNVTPHLLEAMKHLVTIEPEKPLKWLSEFLAQKSLEIEGP